MIRISEMLPAATLSTVQRGTTTALWGESRDVRRQFRRWICRVLVIYLLPMVWSASLATAADERAVPRAALQRQQDLQRQAREKTQALVARILDVQLQNLEENNLDHLPIYQDIQAMRANLNSLVEGEMQQVVELLLSAERASPREQQQSLTGARRLVREIVAKLSAERQQLARRLRRAEIAAQLRRVIDAQTRVWNDTRAVSTQPPSQQERATQAAAEGQRDVNRLYRHLSEALRDVGEWGGEAGTTATEVLRELHAAAVSQELDRAESALDRFQPADAAGIQLEILRTLLKLREQIEPGGGADTARHEDAAAVRRLIGQQSAIRDQTRRTDLQGAEADALVASQQQLNGELERLAERLSSDSGARELLDRTLTAARGAASRLFESRRDPALSEQDKVVGNLEQLAARLDQPAPGDRIDKSAEQLAGQVRDLEQARAAMEQIRRDQAEASHHAAENPAAARQAEDAVVAELARLDENRQLPRAVMARLNDARDAARAAAKSLDESAGRKADPVSEQAVARADRAIERVAAEIEAELDDSRRQGEAVRIGEMARAAETLERAAGTQREVAETARAAAQDRGLSADAAGELRKNQATIGQIAEKVSAGVGEMASASAGEMEKARQSAAAVDKQLEQAQQQPDEASRPAAAAAAEQATAAADSLTRAAAALRSRIADDAKRLAQESGRQAEKVGKVREHIEEGLAKVESPTAERMEQLAAAREQVRSAQIDQQRAAGRPRAAQSMQLSDQIEAALQEQMAAARAGRQSRIASGPSSDESSRAQVAAAGRTARLAASAGAMAADEANAASGGGAASGRLAAELSSAAEAAGAASKLERAGRLAESLKSQETARRALEQARDLARRLAADESSTPAGPIDAAAQGRVGEAAAAAQKLAATDAPEAAETLSRAERASIEAAGQVQAGVIDGIRAAQSKTETELASAAEQLESAMQALAAKQSEQALRDQAQSSRSAEEAVPADPAAVAALRNAQDAAAEAAQSSRSDALDAASAARQRAAQSRARQQTQSAAASLAARQQRLQRDQAAAAAIARLAERQQNAAGEIAAARAALAEESTGDDATQRDPARDAPDSTDSAAATQRQSARRLNQAQQQFAAAQRGTGQGAEAISGQSEIINPPLREALDLASLLPAPEVTPESGAAMPGASPGGDGGRSGRESDSGDDPPGDEPGDTPARTDPGLGTKFVPSSPDVTAAMIAGNQALQRAAALDPSGSRARPGQGQTGTGQPSAAAGQSESADGEPDPNLPTDAPGDSQTAPGESAAGKPLQGLSDQTAGAEKREAAAQAKRPVRDEPWLLRLPPELRQAIRARAQRPAPRSYEDRLQRYFESLD